jgi:hypothetical protein
LDLSVDGLLTIAFARNPRLKATEADGRMAEATITLAAKSKIPNYSLGLMNQTGRSGNTKETRTLYTCGMDPRIIQDHSGSAIFGVNYNSRKFVSLAFRAHITVE